MTVIMTAVFNATTITTTAAAATTTTTTRVVFHNHETSHGYTHTGTHVWGC
jgi:hypothetical protein